ncbi:MAG: VWA domain-containing protein [Deltaproteobacteria bacterium]|nr:VWA domain-containing protein [Deltaproteobacteria bacterium]
MRFQSPEVLWFLVAIPAIASGLVAGYFRRRSTARRFGDERLIRKMITGRSPFLRALKASFLLAGLALTIVALARPQYGGSTRLLRKRGIDIVVALDFSKSMLARDAHPSRIELAKRELTTMLSELGGDRVGMIAFAGETMQYPLTTDYEAAGLFLRDLVPNDMPVGGTALGQAIRAAVRLFENDRTSARRTRVIVLMTDGEDHEGNPVAAAQEAAEAGIRTYVLGIGSGAAEPIPQYADDGSWLGYMRDSSGAVVTTQLTTDNEEQLRAIARVSRGKYLRAARGQVGLQQIREELSHLKQRELRARKVTIYEEKYQVFLLPALLLILADAVLGEAVRRKRSKALGRLGR